MTLLVANNNPRRFSNPYIPHKMLTGARQTMQAMRKNRTNERSFRRAQWKRHGCENVRVLTEGITALLCILPAVYYAKLNTAITPQGFVPMVLAIEALLCMTLLAVKFRLRSSRVCSRQAYALDTAIRARLL